MADPPKFKLTTTTHWTITNGSNTARTTLVGTRIAIEITVEGGAKLCIWPEKIPDLMRMLELTIEHTDNTPTEVELE